MVLVGYIVLLAAGSLVHVLLARKEKNRKRRIFLGWAKCGVAFVLLSACITLPLNHFRYRARMKSVAQIQIGDAASKVIDLLGTPDRIRDESKWWAAITDSLAEAATNPFIRAEMAEMRDESSILSLLLGTEDQIDDNSQWWRAAANQPVESFVYTPVVDYTSYSYFTCYPICGDFVAPSRYQVTVYFSHEKKVAQITMGEIVRLE